MELRILIVDDEEIIRIGIQGKIKKMLPQVQIVGLAQDSTEGLEKVKALNPNIIITDIRMPEINGLKFIELVQEINPKIKFVIISGYQDFEYARSAIRLGVKDYLLKPIENQLLYNILMDLQEALKKEDDMQEEYTSLKQKAITGIESLHNKYLTELIYCKDSVMVSQLTENLRSDGISFIHSDFTVLSILISSIDSKSPFSESDLLPLLKFSIRNISEEMLNPLGKAIAFENLRDENQIVLIINHQKQLSPNNSTDLISICNRLIYTLNKHFQILVSIGIGNSYSSITSLPNSYEESYTAVVQKIIMGENKVIQINDLSYPNKIDFFLNDENKMLLSNYIKDGNYKRAFEIVNNTFRYIKDKKLSFSSIKILYIELLLLISKTVNDMGGNLEKVFDYDFLSESYIKQFSNLDELESWLNDCIVSICNYIADLSKSHGKKVVDDIKEFLEKNYHTEISVNDMASKYFLNPNYLSQLFKNEIGESFVNYLTKIRMEKAKDLLINTDLKSYKIAEMVGYSNPRYFGDVFQKYYGMTPTKFREGK